MLKQVRGGPSIVVCNSCRYSASDRLDRNGTSGGALFFEELKKRATKTDAGVAFTIEDMPCLFACSRSCTIHMREPGKIAYILGDFAPTEATAEAVIDFFAHYMKSEDGVVPYKDWHEGVKGHFIVRIAPDGYVAT